MSGVCVGWAWQQKCGSALRKLILVKLADNADDQGWSWWRQKKLAEACETSRQTVNAHLAELRGMGLIQVIEGTRGDGGRSSSTYRLMGPWVSSDLTGVSPRADTPPVTQLDTMNLPEEEPKAKTPSPYPPPEFLGQQRWRIHSRPGRGPFVADLNTVTCTCENRSSNLCRHLEVAGEAEEHAETMRRKAYRDAVWDGMVGAFGPTSSRSDTGRGKQVTALAELLAVDPLVAKTPEAWQAEVGKRYEALVSDWGVGKVTSDSFSKNWSVAGKLAHGVRGNGNNDESEDRSRFDK